MGDEIKADNLFTDVIQKYPKSRFARLAAFYLDKEKRSKLAKVMKNKNISKTFETRNYPNPFNPETIIQFTMPQSDRVSIKVYDIQGRLVATLLDEYREKGAHTIRWNGKTNNGQQAASGTYFYQVRFKDQVITRKMLLLK